MKPVPLLEITFSDAPQVDREAGVIRGVRILGRVSRNGREYSDAALRQAARLYEGLGVNLNHPDRPQDATRAVEDGIGWLESIDIRADGVYGNLHYFRAHPSADVLVEAAMRNPRRFGLSHNAEGCVARRHGKLVVESIETVRSVDVVQSPATNSGLFESENPIVNCTVREVLQEAGGPLAQLIAETPYQPAAGETLSLPETADCDERIAVALQSLLVNLLEDEHVQVPKRLENAARLLRAHETLAAGQGPAEGNAPSFTQLIERIERVEVQAHCRNLLEATNRACDAARLQQLVALPTDDERRRLIESWPEREAARPLGRRPATSRPLFESQHEAAKFPEGTKAFVAAIR